MDEWLEPQSVTETKLGINKELLLTTSEQIVVLKEFCKEHKITAVDCNQSFLKANLKAQLAKAEPLIRAETLREVGESLDAIMSGEKDLIVVMLLMNLVKALKSGTMPEVK